MQAEWVQVLGALHSIWSNKQLSVEKRQEMHFLSNEEKELRKSRKIWEILRMHNWQQESMKKHFRRYWKLSKTVWAISQLLTMQRMGKTRKLMNKIQSLASWAKNMNLAGWWAQPPKQYFTAQWDFGTSIWGLINLCNQDGGTQPLTSMREIWSTECLNRMFLQLWSFKQAGLQPHYHQQHLKSLCKLLILPPDNHKCRKWLLKQQVVQCGWVQRNHSHTNA